MKIKEKFLRRVNAHVQNSNVSCDTKLYFENVVLTVDILNQLEVLTSDKSVGFERLRCINSKLRDILVELKEA